MAEEPRGLTRRGLITGLISLAAAPAIVRASSLMPINSRLVPLHPHWLKRHWDFYVVLMEEMTRTANRFKTPTFTNFASVLAADAVDRQISYEQFMIYGDGEAANDGGLRG